MKDNVFNVLILSVILLIISAGLAYAAPANIILKSPANGKEVTSLSQDFIFSFDQYADILNCSLLIDDAVASVRNTLINIENNKMSAALTVGLHSWYVSCYDSDFNNIISAKNTLSVKSETQAKEGYETIYNNNGLRSYVITPAAGQAPVSLPAMLIGEDIRIIITGKTNYIDLLRMGASGITSFIEFRDRTSGRIYRLLIGENKNLDFDNDEITDIQLALINVERGVNAYFKIIPYPGTTTDELQSAETSNDTVIAQNTTAAPEPVVVVEDNTNTPEQNNAVEQQTDIADASASTGQQQTQNTLTENKGKSTILLAVIAVIFVIAIILVAIKPKKKSSSIAPKQKSQLKEAKKAEKAENAPAPNDSKKPEEKLQSAAVTMKDDYPKKDADEKQDIDIIKSVGKKRR